MTSVVFIIDLVQDVSACRSIAIFVKREFRLPILFIVTAQFLNRDALGVWLAEAREIAAELDAEFVQVDTIAVAMRCLAGRGGMLVASSESGLAAHAFNHALFLAAPPSFTRVTFQHGLECIGFTHNAAHNRNWRHYIGMNCDIAAAWFEPEALYSVQPDQRSKIMSVGPQIALDHPHPSRFLPPKARHRTTMHGLVCENLHSIRFGKAMQNLFTELFAWFSDKVALDEGSLELRPHPGGRYTDKYPIEMPKNVRTNRLPLYKQDLKRFDFCISGPSTVLLDMIWAGIPVAVWISGDPNFDVGIYEGLHFVSTRSDWFAFAQAASADPRPFLVQQQRYLAALNVPDNIPARYRDLVSVATGMEPVRSRFDDMGKSMR